ncbi:hypothetical protein EDC04DRAFT_2603977 [Pisolithus marmoratus]|nr:hypothetical protein EDC04DRAFT_2603977 [Pisolithus marmoratus]
MSKLPLDRKVLPFILYANKAKLSSFGWQKGYPVIAHLTNLPVSIWNGEGIGGGHVVGWLLIVKDVKEHSGKLWFANFKDAVWHKSFRELLQMVEKESETGCWVKCWDGVTHHFFPVILILSADYEEHKNALKVLQEACSQDTTEKKEQILIQQGLCDVDSIFTVITNMDAYHALSWDQLHANCAGKFGDHLWAELLRILDKAGHQAMAKVEKNQKLEDLLKAHIQLGWEALAMFNVLMKNHTHMHVFDNIKAKGITHNFNTKPNEKMHGLLKEKYQRHTNFKNVAQQCRISNYDTYLSNMQANVQNSEGGDTDNVEQEDFFHVRLGSRVKEPLVLEAIEQRSTIDKVFTRLLHSPSTGSVRAYSGSQLGAARKHL